MYMTVSGKRHWVPGHKSTVKALGEVTSRCRGVAEGWEVSCSCGWKKAKSATKQAAGSAYSVHLMEAVERRAAAKRDKPKLRREVWRIPGHKNLLSPVGETQPRRAPTDGWSSACVCGWSDETKHATKRAAALAYRLHLDQVPSEHWPVCRRCEQHVRPSDMSRGSTHLCKKCRTAQTREWAEANPSEWERHRRKSYLKRKYGITPEQADALLAGQDGCCAICGASEGDSRGFRMHIDHCHSTGAVRGVLCNLCNAGLGNFRDNPELMRKAIAYLAIHQGEKTG